MKRNLSHIFLTQDIEIKKFKSIQSGGEKSRIYKDRNTHGPYIKEKLQHIIDSNLDLMPNDFWAYIVFQGEEKLLKVIKSIENKTTQVKISNIKELEDIDQYSITLCVNKKYLTNLYSKVNKYINENTKSDKPCNQELLDRIEDVKTAIIENLWVGDSALIPQSSLKKWCEIWILNTDYKAFFKLCDSLNIIYNPKTVLKFVERVVLQIEINKEDLEALIESYPYIGEFRPVNPVAKFWTEIPKYQQEDWVTNLLARTEVIENSKTSICVMDTGVNNGHPLLNNIITNQECDTCNSEWENTDIDGHGTAMCGLVSYGDIQECLEKNTEIKIKHSVSSVKLLPISNYIGNEKSYASTTDEALSRAKIIHPDKEIICCLAVTEDSNFNLSGNPSSWSAMIDVLASGQNVENLIQEIDDKTLFLVSAGNIDDPNMTYPETNKCEPVQSPSQSWNGLTVGAYTEKDLVFGEYLPMAKKGELSPYSRTSLAWNKSQWPIKPEVVFEGGNKAIDGQCSFENEQHSVLALDNDIPNRFFSTISGTSPATAKASNFAAKIHSEYPHLWPETIRALIVHSAEWTDEMQKQFKPNNNKKSAYANLLRTCGYGVPNQEKAIYSASNSLVLIAENIIQPYQLNAEKNKVETNQMHLYELPWPQEELLSLGAANIELKVTLSYFIEPSPFSMGRIQTDKYKYSSFGLRFDVNRKNEDKKIFVGKINQIDKDIAKVNGEVLDSREKSPWEYSEECGILNGSIHSNIWKGSAADLAQSNILAVYPVMGWWKDRPSLGCYNKKARYSLVVSLSTPETEIDIYTPIANMISVPTTIKTSR